MTTLSRGNPGKQNVQILSLQFLSPDPHKAKETGGQIQKDRPFVLTVPLFPKRKRQGDRYKRTVPLFPLLRRRK